jgi:putative DNA primase/helicase
MGAEMATLWIAHTYLYERFTHSPRLSIVSPTENCGKSTFLRALRLFVCRPMLSANLTVATGFRLVELYKPTLLCDETNKWLATGSELVGILNSGYEAGSFTHRCIGDKHELRSFSCYSPVAMASIGQIRDSELRSRCLVIPMQRAKNGEVKKGWDSTDLEHETALARKLARWVKDNGDKVSPRPSSMPRDVYGRLADNWRPLFAMAEAVGGEWLKHCEDALAIARAAEAKRDEDNQKARLLADIKGMFEERALAPSDYVLSSDMAEHLSGLEGRGWDEANHGRPINVRWLSLRLGDFGLSPDRLPRAAGSSQRRGYPVAAFLELFERWLTARPAWDEIYPRKCLTTQIYLA